MKAPIVGSMVLVTIYLLFKVCLQTFAFVCGGLPGVI